MSSETFARAIALYSMFATSVVRCANDEGTLAALGDCAAAENEKCDAVGTLGSWKRDYQGCDFAIVAAGAAQSSSPICLSSEQVFDVVAETGFYECRIGTEKDALRPDELSGYDAIAGDLYWGYVTSDELRALAAIDYVEGRVEFYSGALQTKVESDFVSVGGVLSWGFSEGSKNDVAVAFPFLKNVGGTLAFWHYSAHPQASFEIYEAPTEEWFRSESPASNSVSRIHAPKLRDVAGNFSIVGFPFIDEISLPGLKTIARSLMIQQNHGTYRFAEMVENLVPGGIMTYPPEFRDIARLRTIALPALETIGEGLEISDNPTLESIDLANVVSISGYLVIEDNPNLTTLSLPKLKTAPSEILIRNTRLATAQICSWLKTNFADVDALFRDGRIVLENNRFANAFDGACHPL